MIIVVCFKEVKELWYLVGDIDDLREFYQEFYFIGLIVVY